MVKISLVVLYVLHLNSIRNYSYKYLNWCNLILEWPDSNEVKAFVSHCGGPGSNPRMEVFYLSARYCLQH